MKQEELIAECIKRFPNHTKVRSLYQGSIGISNGTVVSGSISGDIWFRAGNNCNVKVYDAETKTFATVVGYTNFKLKLMKLWI